jgi:hypothetical protein
MMEFWFGEDFAVEIIEFARHLAGEFDVRLVVTSNGDGLRARQQNIHGLQNGIAKQTERHGVDVGVARHVFEGGHPFEARNGDQHFKEQIQLIGFRNRRLDEDGADVRVNADGEIIQHGLADEGWNLFDVLRLRFGGQRVQVRDDEEGVVLMLQSHTIFERADVMTEVQASCGAVASE